MREIIVDNFASATPSVKEIVFNLRAIAASNAVRWDIRNWIVAAADELDRRAADETPAPSVKPSVDEIVSPLRVASALETWHRCSGIVLRGEDTGNEGIGELIEAGDALVIEIERLEAEAVEADAANAQLRGYIEDQDPDYRDATDHVLSRLDLRRADETAVVFAWLVENGNQGDDRRYRTMEQGMSAWTPDHNKAIRFARRDDAEMFAAEDDEAWRIVEHGWHDRPSAETVAVRDEQAATITSLCDRLDRIHGICHNDALSLKAKLREVEEWAAGFMPIPGAAVEPSAARSGPGRPMTLRECMDAEDGGAAASAERDAGPIASAVR